MSLVTDIQTVLDETSGAVYWSAERIADAANVILLEVWPKLNHLETHAEMVVAPWDTLVYLPINVVMIPKYIVGNAGTYFPTTQVRLEQYAKHWRSATSGYPKHFVLWDDSRVRPFPSADTEYAFDVYGVPWPEEISSVNTDIDCAPLLHQAIVHGAAAKLLAYSQPAFSAEAQREYNRLLRDYQVSVRNSQSHHIQRLRPGTVFTAAQSGSIRLGQRLS